MPPPESEIHSMWNWLRTHERDEHQHHIAVFERLTKMETLLTDALTRHKTNFETVDQRLGTIEDAVSRVKGGWAAVAIMGSVMVAVSGVVGWILLHVFHWGGPPS